ncbi:NAD-glutamate dehydrogenase domain-containing protein [Vibrio splendidus]|uniref:NAD-glutamate dehydrogenase domain-containing protein n=1 Tax=Vibrio splendidus TaxID=29497 RepID=UPI000D36EABE
MVSTAWYWVQVFLAVKSQSYVHMRVTCAKLVSHSALGAGLSGREISILRAYARYMRQVGFPFSQQYIEDTLSHYIGCRSFWP